MKGNFKSIFIIIVLQTLMSISAMGSENDSLIVSIERNWFVQDINKPIDLIIKIRSKDFEIDSIYKVVNTFSVTIPKTKSLVTLSIVGTGMGLSQNYYNEFYSKSITKIDTIKLYEQDVIIDYFPMFCFKKNSLELINNLESSEDKMPFVAWMKDDFVNQKGDSLKIIVYGYSWKEKNSIANKRANLIFQKVLDLGFDSSQVKIVLHNDIPHKCRNSNQYFLMGTLLSKQFINKDIYSKRMKRIALAYNRRVEISIEC